MPITVTPSETQWLIRLEGEVTLTSAAELKKTILEGSAAGESPRVNLERAEIIDIAILQLLWAAGRQAGCGIAGRVPEAVAAAAQEAGFPSFPGAA